MSKKITHKGKIIKKIGENRYVVEVMPMSACSSCSMGSTCHAASEASDKTFVIESDEDIQINNDVIISISQKNLIYSVLTAYILPIIVMLIIALITDFLFKKDIITAIVSLIVLIAYFIFLKFYMKKSNKLDIVLEKTEGD